MISVFATGRMEVDDGNTFPQDGEAAQNRKPQGRLGAKENACKTQGFSKTLVAARDTTERRAGFEARRVHVARPETNRRFAEALGGAQLAPQAGAYRSALSMLTFYVNRAGKTLPKTQRERLERAKVELKRQFGRE